MHAEAEADGALYIQLADYLRQQIVRGFYPPGSRFPTRADLATRHELAPMTVQRSVGILQQEGWLISGNGVPTVVADPLPLVVSHTQAIEGIAEFDLLDDGRLATVDVIADDDVPSPVYVQLHSWDSTEEHPDLARLDRERVRVIVQVLRPAQPVDDPDASITGPPGMIDS